MAADLPDMGYTSSVDMAKVLVTYLSDADAIRRAILLEFSQAPAHHTITKMRKEHLASRCVVTPAFRPFDGYYPDEARDRALQASRLFVAAIERERSLERVCA